MLFQRQCPSFHLLIHYFNSPFSPTLTCSNLFQFNTDSFHFLIYSFNAIFYATLKYFNFFHFTTFSFHFFICNLNIFLLHLRIPIFFSSLLFFSLYCGMSTLKFACCLTCSGFFFTKQPFFVEGLDVPSFFCFRHFLSVQSFNACCTFLPQLIFFYCIY